jgi:hypothetical protein
MADTLYQGIVLEKGIKIFDSEKLWQQFSTHFVYVDGTDNPMLNNVAGTCAMQGFEWGLFTRLRNPPEPKSADSQAQEFATVLNALHYEKNPLLPAVLELKAGLTPFCETNMYRGMVETFIKKFHDYCGKKVVIRATREVIDWLTPSSTILACDLWLHESTSRLDFHPWKNFAFRSYAVRDMLGTKAAPVIFPHDKAVFDAYLKGGPLPALPASMQPAPVTPPAPVPLTDAQKIAKLRDLTAQMREILG